MLTASTFAINLFLAPARIVTAPLVTSVSAIVLKITNVISRDTAVVGTFEFREDAWARSRGTDGHVVLIAEIVAMLHPVAHLIPRNAFVVVALELLDFVACEVFTQLWSFVTSVTAVIYLVAEVTLSDAQLVITCELIVGTIFAIWITRRTSQFVG